MSLKTLLLTSTLTLSLLGASLAGGMDKLDNIDVEYSCETYGFHENNHPYYNRWNTNYGQLISLVHGQEYAGTVLITKIISFGDDSTFWYFSHLPNEEIELRTICIKK